MKGGFPKHNIPEGDIPKNERCRAVDMVLQITILWNVVFLELGEWFCCVFGTSGGTFVLGSIALSLSLSLALRNLNTRKR
jgi:hypothetical protein